MSTIAEAQVGQALAAWVPFFSLTGAAAATLTGLIFVAVSINVRAIDRDRSAHVQDLARRTLGAFIFILLVSLMCLIPLVDGPSLALGIGITAVVYLLRIAWGVRRRGRSAVDRTTILAVIAYFLTLAAAYGFWRDQPAWLDLMPVILVTTLATAAWNSWDLLIQIGRIDPEGA